jgi:hypothetical protein
MDKPLASSDEDEIHQEEFIPSIVVKQIPWNSSPPPERPPKNMVTKNYSITEVEHSYYLVLAPGERKILQLLAEGLTNSEVSQILHLQFDEWIALFGITMPREKRWDSPEPNGNKRR